jgi:predicted DNA binding CopG/RHH family protein
MVDIYFSWDPNKDRSNQKKHRVGFLEAQTVFFDENALCGVFRMRKNYDFSKSKKNPYAKVLKQQITIRIEPQTINYFKNLSTETGIPYQTLINLYLRDCAEKHRQINLGWNA